jgi:hypothetical protein
LVKIEESPGLLTTPEISSSSTVLEAKIMMKKTMIRRNR